jgi:hypothetical protein
MLMLHPLLMKKALLEQLSWRLTRLKQELVAGEAS